MPLQKFAAIDRNRYAYNELLILFWHFISDPYIAHVYASWSEKKRQNGRSRLYAYLLRPFAANFCSSIKSRGPLDDPLRLNRIKISFNSSENICIRAKKMEMEDGATKEKSNLKKTFFHCHILRISTDTQNDKTISFEGDIVQYILILRSICLLFSFVCNTFRYAIPAFSNAASSVFQDDFTTKRFWDFAMLQFMHPKHDITDQQTYTCILAAKLFPSTRALCGMPLDFNEIYR